ncbi:MAG TPA: hypothetical protein VMF57_05800 [Solirubrobacteraceae bacterium]|nr:hypothetical protein [Solirubrobacteraceae bacterium]
MATDDLQRAFEGLSIERLQRLVDRLEEVSGGRTARRRGVQLLVRRANAVLAYRNVRRRADDRRAGPPQSAVEQEGSRS